MRLSIICFFLAIPSATFAQAPSISFQNLIGGSALESSGNILPLEKGEFMLAGSTSSSNSSITNHGISDIWLVKLNNTCQVLWQKCLGG